MDKLRFGTAGIPISCPGDTLAGVKFVKELGLECMELEFVRQVNISEDKAPEIKKMASEKGVQLSCHAPYFINLNSEENIKIEASKKRIFNAARIAYLCGASSVVVHAGFYMKSDPEKTYQMIKQGFQEVLGWMREEGIDICLRVETMGKTSQWGSLTEVLRLSSEVKGVLPCIDFCHLFARNLGKVNNYIRFCRWLEEYEKVLGRRGLDNMHIHMSGVEYGSVGEKWHLTLNESELKWQEVLKALKQFDCKGVVISESPNIEKDAVMMKKYYSEL